MYTLCLTRCGRDDRERTGQRHQRMLLKATYDRRARRMSGACGSCWPTLRPTGHGVAGAFWCCAACTGRECSRGRRVTVDSRHYGPEDAQPCSAGEDGGGGCVALPMHSHSFRVPARLVALPLGASDGHLCLIPTP